MMKKTPIYLACLCFALPVYAGDFFLSESVAPKEAGEWEMSFGIDYSDNDEADSQTTTFSLGVEYGITDSLQAELEYAPYVQVSNAGDDDSGQGNVEVGLKYSFMHIDGSPFSLAIGWEHEFASGDDLSNEGDDAEEEKDADEVYLIAALDLDEAGDQQVALQVGREFEDDENQNFANLTYFNALDDDLALSAEYNWSEEEDERAVTPGLFWEPDEGLELGLGVSIGVGDNDTRSGLARVMYEFE